MKLALRTAAVPGWDFPTAAKAAKDLGYDGVEVHASFDPSAASVTNVLFTDSKKICEIFDEARITIASVSFSMGADTGELARVIDTAVALEAVHIRVIRGNAAANIRGFDAFASKVLSLADTAAAAGITLLLENEPLPGSVSRLWRTVDGFNHRSIACCWSPDNGRLAGELPLVSIPTLNSRIRVVRFGDIDAPEIPIKKILQRLAGIGFDGWLLTECKTEPDCNASLSKLRQLLQSLKPPLAASHAKTH